MARRIRFGFGEWYHCFNRGTDKRRIFDNEYDANRFLMLLYLANGTVPVSLFSLRKLQLSKIFETDRGDLLVAIGAYCLMPNHYHLLLKEVVEGGITSFMRKLGTAYTMYFNSRHERVGHLFSGPFRARHVVDDRYFQRVIQYIHFNPVDLYEPQWKSGKVTNMRTLESKINEYRYSSIRSQVSRVKDPIISQSVREIAHSLNVRRMLEESRHYYADINKEAFER